MEEQDKSIKTLNLRNRVLQFSALIRIMIITLVNCYLNLYYNCLSSLSPVAFAPKILTNKSKVAAKIS